MTDKRRSKYTRRKNGLWQTSIVVGHNQDGKPQRKHLYAKTKQELAQKESELRQQLGTGTYATTNMTVSTFLERWLDTKERQVKESTIASYRSNVGNYILPRVGKLKLADVKPLHLQSALEEIADTSGARTSNLCRTILNGALKQAVRWHLLPNNPVQGTSPIREERRETTIYTAEQTVAFLNTAHKHRLYALFHLALAGGFRSGELFGLQWTDLEDDALCVRRSLYTRTGDPIMSTPKTKKGERRVYLAPADLQILEAHRARQDKEHELLGNAWTETDHIFVSEVGTLLNGKNVNRILHDLQDAAGVPRTGLHALRHMHGTMLAGRVEPRTLADRLGHADVHFTFKTYVHPVEAQRRRAAISLADLLQGDSDTQGESDGD